MRLTHEDREQIQQFRAQAREDRNLINSLRQARLNAGLKQEDVARMLAVDTSTISRIETGKTSPTLLQLQSLAVATGVTITHTVTPHMTETTASVLPAEKQITLLTEYWGTPRRALVAA